MTKQNDANGLKLYKVYLPKNKDSRVENRNVNNMISNYTEGLSKILGDDQPYSIIASPGYLSKRGRMEDFYDSLKKTS